MTSEDMRDVPLGHLHIRLCISLYCLLSPGKHNLKIEPKGPLNNANLSGGGLKLDTFSAVGQRALFYGMPRCNTMDLSGK